MSSCYLLLMFSLVFLVLLYWHSEIKFICFPLCSINSIWGYRRPPWTRKGEEDKQSLTPSTPQGPNTWTSSGNNIFFHSAQGQAATAIAADAAMERRTMMLSSSSNSRQVHVTSSVNDDADHMFNCSPIHRIDTK